MRERKVGTRTTALMVGEPRSSVLVVQCQYRTFGKYWLCLPCATVNSVLLLCLLRQKGPRRTAAAAVAVLKFPHQLYWPRSAIIVHFDSNIIQCRIERSPFGFNIVTIEPIFLSTECANARHIIRYCRTYKHYVRMIPGTGILLISIVASAQAVPGYASCMPVQQCTGSTAKRVRIVYIYTRGIFTLSVLERPKRTNKSECWGFCTNAENDFFFSPTFLT